MVFIGKSSSQRITVENRCATANVVVRKSPREGVAARDENKTGGRETRSQRDMVDSLPEVLALLDGLGHVEQHRRSFLVVKREWLRVQVRGPLGLVPVAGKRAVDFVRGHLRQEVHGCHHQYGSQTLRKSSSQLSLQCKLTHGDRYVPT